MERNEDPINLSIFTKKTKSICLCTATSIFIIIAFVITPLSNFYKTSIIMKLVALIILSYTIYLNYDQTELLRSASKVADTEQIQTQLNKNIVCSYVFTLFIGLLFIFVLKSIFF